MATRKAPSPPTAGLFPYVYDNEDDIERLLEAHPELKKYKFVQAFAWLCVGTRPKLVSLRLYPSHGGDEDGGLTLTMSPEGKLAEDHGGEDPGSDNSDRTEDRGPKTLSPDVKHPTLTNHELAEAIEVNEGRLRRLSTSSLQFSVLLSHLRELLAEQIKRAKGGDV